MNRPMTIDGADSRMSLTNRVSEPSQPLGSYSARYTPAMMPMGVPTQVASITITNEPQRALAMPPASFGGGVISLNVAHASPPMPSLSVSQRIHTSQNIPKPIASSESV